MLVDVTARRVVSRASHRFLLLCEMRASVSFEDCECGLQGLVIRCEQRVDAIDEFAVSEIHFLLAEREPVVPCETRHEALGAAHGLLPSPASRITLLSFFTSCSSHFRASAEPTNFGCTSSSFRL